MAEGGAPQSREAGRSVECDPTRHAALLMYSVGGEISEKWA